MAEITRYIDPDVAAGDGSGDSRINAFSGAIAWEADQEQDLDGGGNFMVVHCFASNSSADAFGDSFLDINGWGLSAASYIEMVADVGDRHDGTANSGYFITYTGAYGAINREEFVRFRFIEVEGDNAGIGLRPNFGLSGPATSDIRIEGCLLHNSGNIIEVDGASDNIYISNTIIYDGVNYGILISADSAVKIYSTTIVDTDRCVRLNAVGSTADMKNVLMRHDGVQCLLESNGTFTLDYCATNDDTADDFLGGNNQVNQTYTFVNDAGNDFHLDETDIGAIDLGLDTSGEGAPLNFTDDIDAEERTGTWDIGADQFVAAVSGIVVLRRRRDE